MVVTNRVVPQQTTSESGLSFNKSSRYVQNNTLQNILNEEDSSHQEYEYHDTPERNCCLRFLLSVRLFLIVMITFVVLTTALTIWVTSYTMNEKASLDQVTIIINNMNEKIGGFVNSQLLPAKYVADSIADDFHHGFVDMVESIQHYLFTRVKQFGVTVTNLCLGEDGNNALYAYSVNADGSLVYARKPQNSRFFMYKANMTTGEYYPDKITMNITYVVAATDYYKESITVASQYSAGGFGAPYKVINGPISSFWSTPIYRKVDLESTNRTRIGFAKINISLAAIAKFLSSVKVMQNGFVIISEYGNDFIIGSSLSVDGIDSKRVKATEITSRNAGILMGKLFKYQQENNIANLTSFQTTLNNEMGESFLISSSPYTFHNLKWRLTLFFDESEIKKGIYQSSFVILGVSIAVSILGVIVSILVGWVVTSPFAKLQEDFKNIETLHLSEIKRRSSVFSEAKSIYSSLSETIRWLSEIRAFIPDSILNQLDEAKQDIGDANTENSNSFAAKNSNNNFNNFDTLSRRSSNGASDAISIHQHQSNHRNTHSKSNNLFKLGLGMKECSIIYLTIPNLNQNNFEYESGLLQNLISKCLTSISQICKTCKADLQIKAYNEYVIIFSPTDKNPSITALDTSLKIQSIFNSLNEQILKDDQSPLKLCIAISSGQMIQGNVGNRQMRYMALVGEVIDRAKMLNDFSWYLNVSILCDSKTFLQTKEYFITRPTERIWNKEKGQIDTVYEVVRKNVVQDDEWFYELEQKKTNAKFDEFNSYFSKLFVEDELDHEDLNKVLNSLVEAKHSDPNDIVLNRLEHLVATVIESSPNPSFIYYHSCVVKDFVSFISPGVKVPSPLMYFNSE